MGPVSSGGRNPPVGATANKREVKRRDEEGSIRGEEERREGVYLEAKQRRSGAAGDEEEQLAFLLVREALHHLPEGLDDRVGGRVPAWDQETEHTASFTMSRPPSQTMAREPD